MSQQQYEMNPQAQQNPASVPAQQQPSNEQSLLGAEDIRDLGARWNAIQANFVDDPRAAVKEADQLVREVFDRISQGFTRQRDELARKWGQSQESSTEELRLAMQRYRGFLERFLSVT